MKHLFILLIVFSISVSLKSQNCASPVSSIAFKQKFSQLSSIPNDHQRLASANDFVLKNCLLTYQVKQIAELFNDDISRLAFIQKAYPATFDKENVYDLYDAFAYFSTAMRFHDFIEDQTQKPDRHNRRLEVQEVPYSFPSYNYPSYESYRDKTPCSQPLSDDEFLNLLRNVSIHHDDDSRISAAIQLEENNCLTVAQIMKMGSIIEKEANRLDYLKRSYDHTYDVGNFQYTNQLLKEKQNSSDFEVFMKERRNRPVRDNKESHHGRNTCVVTEAEMLDIVSNIKTQTFENTKITMAKQIVRTKQCFSSMQIKQLLEVFDFENSKLDIAKYCYAFCIDRSEYYKINSSFTYSTSVDDLTKFISEQQ